MQHLVYRDFFKDLAQRHYLIQHEVDGRQSFFMMNGEHEMQQALVNGAAFPALCLRVYRGRLHDDGTVSDVMSVIFEVRTHVANPMDFDGIETARDLCKEQGMNMICFILQQIEDEGNCGPFNDLDPNSVQYDFTGPININEYGCMFSFESKDMAFNPLTKDLSTIFL